MIKNIVLGSINADFLFKVQEFPHMGQTTHCYDFMPMLGGKGGNQAAAIARLGGDVCMVGKVGKDAFGPQSIENLEKQGVDISNIIFDEIEPTGTAMGIVADNGENVIVVSKGANGNVNQADVDLIEKLLPQSHYLILQLEIPMEMVLYAIDKAKKFSVEVILNPAPAYPIPKNYFSKIDYLIPNEQEASEISGREITDLTTAILAGKDLISFGVRTVIITLGNQGSMLIRQNEARLFPAISINAVDPTTCGDAFVGGVVVGMERGYKLEEAILFANCAGAITATRFGAQPSLPQHQEVEKMFNEIKNDYVIKDLSI